MYKKTGHTLIWSFRNRASVLIKSLLTANATCPKSVDFQLVDASSDDDTIKEVRLVASGITERRIRICEATYRTSLSQAWNLGMMLTENRYAMFSSSDVVFDSGWFEAIDNAFCSGEKYVLINNHSVFGLDKAIIPTVGWFDEGFGIGPHFDPDYMIRLSESNIRLCVVPNNGYYVHDEEDKKYEDRILENEANRLPMNCIENEVYFRGKWKSGWPGWDVFRGSGKALPHPPTHKTQVVRLRPEIDPHPRFTEKIKCIL